MKCTDTTAQIEVPCGMFMGLSPHTKKEVRRIACKLLQARWSAGWICQVCRHLLQKGARFAKLALLGPGRQIKLEKGASGEKLKELKKPTLVPHNQDRKQDPTERQTDITVRTQSRLDLDSATTVGRLGSGYPASRYSCRSCCKVG